MTEHNMKHLDHIRQVAEEDLAYVDAKDRSYGGSWKRRGGVGAFMMLARKWDRLENMLSGAYKFDIFEAIGDLGGATEVQGTDGTVLAEIRDLRRYLMLVEAEMIARGAVETKPGFGSVVAIATQRELASRAQGSVGVFHLTNTDGPSPKCYDVGHGRVCEGDSVILESENDPMQSRLCVVKEIYQDGCVLVDCGPAETTMTKWHRVRPSRRVVSDVERRVPRRSAAAEGATRAMEIDPFAAERYAYAADTPSCGDGSFDVKQQRLDERAAEARQRTPEDGGQHANLVPYVVDDIYFGCHGVSDELRDKFWRRLGQKSWVLEPHVESTRMPRVLQMCYDMRGDHYVIQMKRVPPDVRDLFPILRLELNMKEHEQLPEWQRPFYTWVENENKLRLSDQYLSWGPEL